MSDEKMETDYEFTEVRKEKTVKIKNPESGQSSVYVIREMMGDGLAEWTKFQFTRIAGKGKRGKPRPEDADFSDFNAKLISLCMVDSTGKPVPKEVISQWPASTQTGLFNICQSMNGLADEGDEGKSS